VEGQVHLTVAVATAGRRETLSTLIGLLARQARAPDLLAICPAAPEDVDQAVCDQAPFPVKVVAGPRGSSAQRNALLDRIETDLVLFMDDDFVPADDYLRECEQVFLANPDVVMMTGTVIADGAVGPGLTVADAERILSTDEGAGAPALVDVYNGYGCNMAVRAPPVQAAKVRFDEDLPLYGWLEDVDFSRLVAPFGKIVRAESCRGVHLGVKRGRTSGVKFGYSQIANPLYLARKGTMRLDRALSQMARNLAQNCARALRPEPWVDRRGRLRGNLKAIQHLMAGRISPPEVLKL
jgi:GT2 family glycosyltransferase